MKFHILFDFVYIVMMMEINVNSNSNSKFSGCTTALSVVVSYIKSAFFMWMSSGPTASSVMDVGNKRISRRKKTSSRRRVSGQQLTSSYLYSEHEQISLVGLHL